MGAVKNCCSDRTDSVTAVGESLDELESVRRASYDVELIVEWEWDSLFSTNSRLVLLSHEKFSTSVNCLSGQE